MSALYWDRLTVEAQAILRGAEAEAELSHHSYIGSEHLLLAMLQQPQSAAYRFLKLCRIDEAAVRETIDSVLGKHERLITGQVIPTSRTRRIIDLAYEIATSFKEPLVGSEHLFFAIISEGGGIAAHILEDMGLGERSSIAILAA